MVAEVPPRRRRRRGCTDYVAMYCTPRIATPIGMALLGAPLTPDGGDTTEGRVPTGSAVGRLLLAAIGVKSNVMHP